MSGFAHQYMAEVLQGVSGQADVQQDLVSRVASGCEALGDAQVQLGAMGHLTERGVKLERGLGRDVEAAHG